MSETEEFLKKWADAVKRPTGPSIKTYYPGSPFPVVLRQLKGRAIRYCDPRYRTALEFLQGFLAIDVMWLTALLPQVPLDAAYVYCPYMPLTYTISFRESPTDAMIAKASEMTLEAINYWYKYL